MAASGLATIPLQKLVDASRGACQMGAASSLGPMSELGEEGGGGREDPKTDTIMDKIQTREANARLKQRVFQ